LNYSSLFQNPADIFLLVLSDIQITRSRQAEVRVIVIPDDIGSCRISSQFHPGEGYQTDRFNLKKEFCILKTVKS
jgi:hypothetical protein